MFHEALTQQLQRHRQRSANGTGPGRLSGGDQLQQASGREHYGSRNQQKRPRNQEQPGQRPTGGWGNEAPQSTQRGGRALLFDKLQVAPLATQRREMWFQGGQPTAHTAAGRASTELRRPDQFEPQTPHFFSAMQSHCNEGPVGKHSAAATAKRKRAGAATQDQVDDGLSFVLVPTDKTSSNTAGPRQTRLRFQGEVPKCSSKPWRV